MSSRKAATAKAVATKSRPARRCQAGCKAGGASRPPKPAAKPCRQGCGQRRPRSAEATALAAKIERDLRDGRLDTLTPQAFQALMAALCKSYGTQLEAGARLPAGRRSQRA